LSEQGQVVMIGQTVKERRNRTGQKGGMDRGLDRMHRCRIDWTEFRTGMAKRETKVNTSTGHTVNKFRFMYYQKDLAKPLSQTPTLPNYFQPEL
jgi:hypothetical protein